MKCTLPSHRGWGAMIGLISLITALSSLAYPPAPDHLFYGVVRDEMGNPLTTQSAEILLETTSGIQLKTQVIPGLQAGVNYQLKVPMDSGITADLYKPTALRPTVPFRIKVRIGQTVYLPIEMKGDFAHLGQPGQRTRLDLTLGEDANGNGLPDAWERALLQVGGGTGAIRPEDDFDGDGLSNLEEYIAGTYAFDSQDGFALKINRTENQAIQLSFMAIRGRTYSIVGSADFHTWIPVQFRIPANGADAPFVTDYYASDVRVLRVEVLSPADQPSMRFFNLIVQ
jgi:hypothetical protein